MKKLAPFPDLGISMKVFDIGMKLENYRFNDSVIGFQIDAGLSKHKLNSLIKELKIAIEDSREMYVEVLGEELVNDILTVKI